MLTISDDIRVKKSALTSDEKGKLLTTTHELTHNTPNGEIIIKLSLKAEPYTFELEDIPHKIGEMLNIALGNMKVQTTLEDTPTLEEALVADAISEAHQTKAEKKKDKKKG